MFSIILLQSLDSTPFAFQWAFGSDYITHMKSHPKLQAKHVAVGAKILN
jgi:hypothetical protein